MAGEQMSSGSTVYVTVSTGPQTSYIRMPNVIGLSEEAAIKRLCRQEKLELIQNGENSDNSGQNSDKESNPTTDER
jgi:beta-lactam-binding protein with PASTA domain